MLNAVLQSWLVLTGSLTALLILLTCAQALVSRVQRAATRVVGEVRRRRGALTPTYTIRGSASIT